MVATVLLLLDAIIAPRLQDQLMKLTGHPHNEMASFLSWELDQRDKEIERLKLELETEKKEIIRLKAVEDQQEKKIEDLSKLLKQVQDERDDLDKGLEESKNDSTVLGLRVSQLEQENEQQAIRYSELCKHLQKEETEQSRSPQRQDPPIRQRSAPVFGTSQSERPPLPPAPELDKAKEKKLKSCVTNDLSPFIELTNFMTLVNYLLSYKVTTIEENRKLSQPTDFRYTSEEKARYFYLEVLDTKGSKAYTLLHHCLKLEQEHLGHKDLVEILDKALDET